MTKAQFLGPFFRENGPQNLYGSSSAPYFLPFGKVWFGSLNSTAKPGNEAKCSICRGSVKTPVGLLFKAVCGPKFMKLRVNVENHSQFPTLVRLSTSCFVQKTLAVEVDAKWPTRRTTSKMCILGAHNY